MHETFSSRSTVLYEPIHSLFKIRKPFEHIRFDGRHGKERYEADHRTHAKRLAAFAVQMKHVVVKSVLLVPK